MAEHERVWRAIGRRPGNRPHGDGPAGRRRRRRRRDNEIAQPIEVAVKAPACQQAAWRTASRQCRREYRDPRVMGKPAPERDRCRPAPRGSWPPSSDPAAQATPFASHGSASDELNDTCKMSMYCMKQARPRQPHRQAPPAVQPAARVDFRRGPCAGGGRVVGTRSTAAAAERSIGAIGDTSTAWRHSTLTRLPPTSASSRAWAAERRRTPMAKASEVSDSCPASAGLRRPRWSSRSRRW